MLDCFIRHKKQLLFVNLHSDNSVPTEIKPDKDAEVKNLCFENTDELFWFQNGYNSINNSQLTFSDKTNALFSKRSLVSKLLDNIVRNELHEINRDESHNDFAPVPNVPDVALPSDYQ